MRWFSFSESSSESLRQLGAALVLVFVFLVIGGSEIAVAVVDSEEGHFQLPPVSVAISNLTDSTQFSVIQDCGSNRCVACDGFGGRLDSLRIRAIILNRGVCRGADGSGQQSRYQLRRDTFPVA